MASGNTPQPDTACRFQKEVCSGQQSKQPQLPHFRGCAGKKACPQSTSNKQKPQTGSSVQRDINAQLLKDMRLSSLPWSPEKLHAELRNEHSPAEPTSAAIVAA